MTKKRHFEIDPGMVYTTLTVMSSPTLLGHLFQECHLGRHQAGKKCFLVLLVLVNT